MDYKDILLTLYHKEHSLVRHHLDSFNDFLNVKIKEIIETHGKIYIPEHKWTFELSNVQIEPPLITENHIDHAIYPQQCRLRAITYASKVKVDVLYTKADKTGSRKLSNVLLCSIPVMVKSDACRLKGLSNHDLVKHGECVRDPGGYFIVKGTEKVYLMQEQMIKNRKIVDKNDISKKNMKIAASLRRPGSKLVCSVVSSTVEKKTKTMVFSTYNHFFVDNHLFIEPVPLYVLLLAFGLTFGSTVKYVGLEKNYMSKLEESMIEAIKEGVTIPLDAQLWLLAHMKRTDRDVPSVSSIHESTEKQEEAVAYVREQLRQRVLQHIAGPGYTSFEDRGRYLCLMVRRILQAENNEYSLIDRDFYGVKRIDVVGDYMSLAFEDKLQNMMFNIRLRTLEGIKRTSTKEYNPIQMMNASVFTSSLMSHVSSGRWNLVRFQMKRHSVTQDLNRLSYMATLGHLARINSNSERATGARAIHMSQIGLVCTADTPEGAQCGLVKSLAFLTEVTTDVDSRMLRQLIKGMEPFGGRMDSFEQCTDKRIVSLNGVPLGWTEDPPEFAYQLVGLRRRGHIHPHVSIYFSNEEETLHIACDGGRLIRPYVVVEDGKSMVMQHILDQINDGTLDWANLVRGGIIEYLDVMESLNECLVAFKLSQLLEPVSEIEEYTHLEIDPATLLGTVASIIPFPHHNQSPRNTYQCAMGKQAVGVVASNQDQRFDGVQHTLLRPQRPLTLSQIGRQIGYDELPAGQNAIVAITTFGGHDMEDALIVNKSSLDMGLFRSHTKRSFKVELKGDLEKVGVSVDRTRSERNLGIDGTLDVGARVSNYDVVINKLVPEEETFVPGLAGLAAPTQPRGMKTEPTIYKGLEDAQCIRSMVTQNEDGYKVFRATTLQMRTPEMGDKLSSRHGQKGVIGKIIPASMLPRTFDGVTPDIIMNPHGFPSRMTTGKLIELLANKAAVLDGRVRDASAFATAGHFPVGSDDAKANEMTDADSYRAVLERYGFDSGGKEVLICPRTGEPFEADIYIGPVYYQRLKHMVQDKVHARSRGQNMPLTRQPMEGRANEGGLRVGEMERDCLIAYGASSTIRERMMFSSDPYRASVCGRCGLMASSRNWCRMCDSSTNIKSVVMPYATKLLVQELSMMNIGMKFGFGEEPEHE